jgi:hypothetical protein
MCIFHRWTRWSRPRQSFIIRDCGNFGATSEDPALRQYRICRRCGAVQSRLVGDGEMALAEWISIESSLGLTATEKRRAVEEVIAEEAERFGEGPE